MHARMLYLTFRHRRRSFSVSLAPSFSEYRLRVIAYSCKVYRRRLNEWYLYCYLHVWTEMQDFFFNENERKSEARGWKKRSVKQKDINWKASLQHSSLSLAPFFYSSAHNVRVERCSKIALSSLFFLFLQTKRSTEPLSVYITTRIRLVFPHFFFNRSPFCIAFDMFTIERASYFVSFFTASSWIYYSMLSLFFFLSFFLLPK